MHPEGPEGEKGADMMERQGAEILSEVVTQSS